MSAIKIGLQIKMIRTIVEWFKNLCQFDIISTGKTIIRMKLLFSIKASKSHKITGKKTRDTPI